MTLAPWYAEYLLTPHWLRLREEKFVAALRMCERCGEGAKHRGDVWIGLNVHHRTYERLGHEELDDLEVLCRHCHEVEHELAADTDANRIRHRRRLAVKVTEYDEDHDSW